MFDKVLVINRGEIALRVIRACRALGVKSVAAYSEADADSPHLKEADERVCIGPGPSAQSYLNQDAILAAVARALLDVPVTVQQRVTAAVHPPGPCSVLGHDRDHT